MPDEYFSDREGVTRARTLSDVTPAAWGGIVAEVDARIRSGGFGLDFPEDCPDGRGTYGTSTYLLELALKAEVPQCPWPLQPQHVPALPVLMDMIEFMFEHVANPTQGDYHPFFGHFHLGFDRESGRDAFRARINRIFVRNGLAFELRADGAVRRTLPAEAGEVLAVAEVQTGDAELDRLLQIATARFLDPDIDVRRDALESLWDSWERLKTLLPGKDKRESAEAMLAKVSCGVEFRKMLEKETTDLTRIGNTFRIRHSETHQELAEHASQVDYLFLRMAGMIRLVLTSFQVM